MISAYENAAARLLSAIAKDRAPHAVFVSAPPPFDALLVRRAAALFCTGSEDASRLENCADYFELNQPLIKVDAIRELLEELSKRPFHEGGRAVAILAAHNMNENAQNVLLKSLEEPPSGTMFLLTGNEDRLLPTIRSRCSRIAANCAKEDVTALLSSFGATPRDAEELWQRGGTPQCAVRLYQDEDFRKLREQALSALQQLLSGQAAFSNVKPLAAGAQDVLFFMQLYMQDVQSCRELGLINHCLDYPREIKAAASRFTSGRLNCIILMLAEAERRLPLGQPSAVLDRLFTGILKTAAGG